MTATNHIERADFVQGMVADVHGKLARWFRSENADLIESEVQATVDFLLLYHLVVFAVNRDRAGVATIKAMIAQFGDAVEEVAEMVIEAGA